MTGYSIPVIDSHISLPPTLYRLFHLPFGLQKLIPLLRNPEFARVQSLVELGCGSGMNRPHISVERYTGIDIDPAAIEYANRLYPGEFVVGDIVKTGSTVGRFGGVLLNSVFHHLSDESVRSTLKHLPSYLEEDGSVFCIDALHQPKRWSLPGILERADRGRYFRTISHWRQLFEGELEIRELREFQVRVLGQKLYDLFYLIGKPKGPR